MPNDLDTIALTDLLTRARAGEAAARDDLIRRTERRLEALARKMLRGYPGVGRWEDTADVYQRAVMRLLTALDVVTPASTREFFGLAAEQIRRTLLDLARHYQGARGLGRNHHSWASPDKGEKPAILDPPDSRPDPDDLDRWAGIHVAVEQLPTEEREVFMLTFYHGWTQPRIAELFGVDERTIRRRWRAACEMLNVALGGKLPDREEDST